MFEELIEQVNKAQRILLFPHINMDGDSVGSCAALCLALRRMGKACYILCDEAVPEYVDFLDFDGFVTEAPYVPELSIAVDNGDESRIERRLEVFRSAPVSLCIDHHIPHGPYADYSVIRPDYAAAGMLVYEFIKALGVEFDKDMAAAVYTATLTDTGSFRYSNTDARVHRIVAELMDTGFDHAAICNYVYENKPMLQHQLECEALTRAEFVKGGKGVVSYVTYERWSGAGAPYSYTDTGIDVLRSIKGVEIAAFLKEKTPGVFKVSFRSKSYANVVNIAERHDGGGHVKAAACTLEMPFDEALAVIKAEVEEAL